jgi:hypothetical protein
MADDFATRATPLLAAHLDPGEELRGVVAANAQKTFSATTVALGPTDRRLLVLPVDRKIEPKGPLQVVSAAAALAAAKIDGAGDGWWTATAAIMDSTSLTLRIQTDDGEKLKLMMTRGGSKLFGGETQRDGVTALIALLAAARS